MNIKKAIELYNSEPAKERLRDVTDLLSDDMEPSGKLPFTVAENPFDWLSV